MANLINLKIVNPDKVFYEGQVKELHIETEEGRREILPNHALLIALLRPAISKVVTEKGEEMRFFLSTGILKVGKEEVVVLCDAAEWPKDINKKRAEESKKRAEERLSKKDGVDIQRAKLSLMRAIKRIEASDLI